MSERDAMAYEGLVGALLEAKLGDSVDLSDFHVFRDKHYVGKSGHTHQIDVSAELKVAGVRIVVLVECKHYSRKVGIDEIMEFATRIDDIAAHKGVVVTTKGFERGAFKIAKSKGIALVEACDLGWRPCLESPVAEMMRHQAFVEGARAFLADLADADVATEDINRATDILSRYDVTSALGSETVPFLSLAQEQPGLSSLRYAGMFAPDHAFIVRLESSQIVLGSRGLFRLAVLALGQRT